MKTTIILKKEVTKDPPPDYEIKPVAFVGYNLKVSVDECHDIQPEIFVFQRDVNSKYISGEVSDSFYSVASVAEMEMLPIGAPLRAGSNFFRAKEVHLVFESVQEVEQAWQKISLEVHELSEANDYSLRFTKEDFIPYPIDSIARIYGDSLSLLSTGEEILRLHGHDCVYSPDISFTMESNAEKYIYFVLYEKFGESFSMKFASSPVEMILQGKMVIEGCNGQPQMCNIFRSKEKVPRMNGSVYAEIERTVES